MVCHLSWKFPSDKANPMNNVADPISFFSIYESLPLCLEQASSNIVLVIVRIPGVQEIEVARAFFASIRPNLSEEILVQVTKEREACSPFPTRFARHVLLITQPKKDLTSELWLYSSLFIINKRLLLWFHSYCSL